MRTFIEVQKDESLVLLVDIGNGEVLRFTGTDNKLFDLNKALNSGVEVTTNKDK